MADVGENYRTTIGSWRKPLMTNNWLTDRKKYKAKEREDYFEQIVLDAVQALATKGKKKFEEETIFLFTQDQVDTVVRLAPFPINVEHIDFYFILTKGEK